MGAGVVSQPAHPLVDTAAEAARGSLDEDGLAPPTPKKRRTQRAIDAPLKVLPVVSYDGFDSSGF
jgi:hypothetical protein